MSLTGSLKRLYWSIVSPELLAEADRATAKFYLDQIEAADKDAMSYLNSLPADASTSAARFGFEAIAEARYKRGLPIPSFALLDAWISARAQRKETA